MRCQSNADAAPMDDHRSADVDLDADRMLVPMPLPVSCQMPIPIANSKSDAEPLSDRITPPLSGGQFQANAPYTTRQSDWRIVRCERIVVASPALRPLRCANQIARIALREFCVRHVGPAGSYFPTKPTHDCDIPVRISDRKSWWICGLSDDVAYCSAYGVTQLRSGFS